MLAILKRHSLFAKRSKSRFGVTEIDYPGHIISKEGVKADPAKISSIVEWPIPSSLKALRGFLGLIGYYRKFIRGYGLIAAWLTVLLNNDSFEGNDRATVAFEELKGCNTITYFESFRFFWELHNWMWCKWVGLMQDGKSIAYYNKALKGKAMSLSTYEKELLALVSSIQKWRPHLLG